MPVSNNLYFAIERISLARFGKDSPGNVYRNYENGRGVCGLVLNVSGKSEYLFSDGTKKILCAGELALFSDKCAYIITNCSDSEYFVHYTVNFEVSATYPLPFDKAYLQLSETNKLCTKLSQLIETNKTGTVEGQMKNMSLLYGILSEIIDNDEIILVDRRDYKTILPAINLIESEYSSNLSIDTLAKHCRMSKTNFRRVFMQVCGTSPIEYLINTRINNAKELVRHTSFSISEISTMCGFNDVEHFCRTFKKRVGTSAGNYRKGTCSSQDKASGFNHSTSHNPL